MNDDAEHDALTRRDHFLIAMYNQLMGDINRHIIVVWQSVGALFGTIVLFSLIEKNVISYDWAAALALLLVIWVIAHVYDAGYWYNRNLCMIANIERQFLKVSDLKDIHYYFGKHRDVNSMLTHLRIQGALGLGVAAVVLIFHFFKVLVPIFEARQEFSLQVLLPWVFGVIGVVIWCKLGGYYQSKYNEFIKNSPGITIDTSGIEYEKGHPTGKT